jgi:DNA-binding NtrC family response regulator
MNDKHCILVVEDEPLVAEMLVEALTERYRAITVGTAEHALEQLSGGGLDLVLLDRLLPGGGSDQVLGLADQMSLPVVLMSGDAEWNSSAQRNDHPFIAKPFDIETLLSTIESTLSRHLPETHTARMHR